MQNQTFLQKIGRLINVSSETFMLIALISLFVMPIAIAKNLEPIVLSEESKQAAPQIVRYVDAEVNEATANAVESHSDLVTNQNILGVFTSIGLDKMITPNEEGLKRFSKVNQSLTVEKFSLSIETANRLQKTNLFLVKNTSSNTKSYNLNVVLDEKLTTWSASQKTLYIGEAKYVIGKDVVPAFTLLPDEEIMIAIDSPRTNPTNLVINVTMQ